MSHAIYLWRGTKFKRTLLMLIYIKLLKHWQNVATSDFFPFETAKRNRGKWQKISFSRAQSIWHLKWLRALKESSFPSFFIEINSSSKFLRSTDLLFVSTPFLKRFRDRNCLLMFSQIWVCSSMSYLATNASNWIRG